MVSFLTKNATKIKGTFLLKPNQCRKMQYVLRYFKTTLFKSHLIHNNMLFFVKRKNLIRVTMLFNAYLLF